MMDSYVYAEEGTYRRLVVTVRGWLVEACYYLSHDVRSSCCPRRLLSKVSQSRGWACVRSQQKPTSETLPYVTQRKPVSHGGLLIRWMTRPRLLGWPHDRPTDQAVKRGDSTQASSKHSSSTPASSTQHAQICQSKAAETRPRSAMPTRWAYPPQPITAQLTSRSG